MHIITQGLVLRETLYKESDKILTVLTSTDGKRTVKAQGCRKKGSALAAASQLLVWSDMTLFEYRDYFTLREASTKEEFRGLRGDLDKLALGSYFAEAAEAVAEEGVAQPALLSLVLNSLHALDKLDKPLPLVKAAFEVRLMCTSGYAPMLDACAACGVPEPEQPRLNLSEGVLHCAACKGEVGEGISMPLDAGALAAMRYAADSPPKRFLSFTLGGESLRRLGDAAEAYLMTQLERGFRTLDYWKELSARSGEAGKTGEA